MGAKGVATPLREGRGGSLRVALALTTIPRKIRSLMLVEALGLPHPEWVYGEAATVLSHLRALPLPLTLRTAVGEGVESFCSPRLIPAHSYEEAETFIQQHARNGLWFITYPFLTAKCSGTALHDERGLVIEACKGDLWHLLEDGVVDWCWQPPQPPRGRWREMVSEHELMLLLRFCSRIPRKHLAEWLITPDGRLFFLEIYPV